MIDLLKGTPLPQDWMALGGILSAAVALGAAFYFLVYQGQMNEVARIGLEDGTVIANLEKARQIEREIGKLKTETEEIELLVSTFERRLPSQKQLTQLIIDLEDMENKEEVKLKIRPFEPEKGENKETIRYEVEAKGTYHNVASFINRLERYERYLKVEKLTLKAAEGQTTAQFMLFTYTFIEDNAGGA